MCRHLGVGANPSCRARVTRGSAASHRGAINHTAGPTRGGPQPRSSPTVTEHTGTPGCAGEDPKGRELEPYPPRGSAASRFSLCGKPLSREPAYRTPKSAESTESCSAGGIGQQLPAVPGGGGPLQRLRPPTSAGATAGPAHRCSSLGPADPADQTPGAPRAP